MKEINYKKFVEKYQPIKNTFDDALSFDGCFFTMTNEEEITYIKKMLKTKKIWSVIDTDGIIQIMSGYQTLNRIGFLITQKKWEEDIIVTGYLSYMT